MKLIQSVPSQGIFHQELTLTPGDEKEGRERGLINIYDEIVYQQLLGIGGAFTESSATMASAPVQPCSPHSIITVLL